MSMSIQSSLTCSLVVDILVLRTTTQYITKAKVGEYKYNNMYIFL